MTDLRFWVLWLATYGGLVGGVASLGAPPDSSREEDREVVVAVISVPPKPEGAQGSRGEGTGSLTWERCASLSGGWADDCFAALAWQRARHDPDGGLEACAAILQPARRDECHADVAEGHAIVDRERSFGICAGIPSLRWADQCVFGIALALVSTEPEAALAICEDAGMWTRFCRHDVNGERAQTDASASIGFCEALERPERPSCWHGVGKYIGRVDPEAAAGACARATTRDDLRGQCAHGVGWAVAESLGPEAARRCEPLGLDPDSCVMGVAYHTKRLGPARARELCDEVRGPADRARCIEVVTRRVEVGDAAPVP